MGVGRGWWKGEIGLTADGRVEDAEDAEEDVGAGCAHFVGCVGLYGFLCWY
jgi:hypothetical protein